MKEFFSGFLGVMKTRAFWADAVSTFAIMLAGYSVAFDRIEVAIAFLVLAMLSKAMGRQVGVEDQKLFSILVRAYACLSTWTIFGTNHELTSMSLNRVFDALKEYDPDWYERVFQSALQFKFELEEDKGYDG